MKHESLVLETLWDATEPSLPEAPQTKVGRPRGRAYFAGIVFTNSSFRCLRLRPTA